MTLSHWYGRYLAVSRVLCVLNHRQPEPETGLCGPREELSELGGQSAPQNL